MFEIIDGKTLSAEVKETVKKKAEFFNKETGRKVCLAVIIVGTDPASEVYVKNKVKAAEDCKIKSLSFHLPEETSFSQLKNLIDGLALDDTVDGILVQLPLPKHLDESSVLSLIPKEKDVDGFLPENVGNLFLGNDTIVSCTPAGVMEMLKSKKINFTGKNAVVIGRSNIVGKPMAALLLKENCTVTICHSKTQNLSEICKSADILIVAIGKPHFVSDDMIKDGAVVIDVGINRLDGKIVGDVDYEKVKYKTSYISPVPGGVGPMTIAMLLKNTVKCAFRRNNLDF